MTDDVVPTDALPTLREWAKLRGQPVTIFDLETTTYIPHVKWMGITEIGMLTILSSGRIKSTCAFVDPERNIPPKVRELTGITNEDVRGQPTWAVWARKLHQYAQKHVMVGYNSRMFDCVVVSKQNARYGVEKTNFSYSLDAMALPGVNGKLAEAAAAHNIFSETYHRSFADVWVTAQLVEVIAQKHGFSVLDNCIGKIASSGRGGLSPRKNRESEILAYYKENHEIPELELFGRKYGIKKSTCEGDVIRLINAGDLPRSVLENTEVQNWLEPLIGKAIKACWIGEAEGRLNPLLNYLPREAPDGFDYTQLKLAIGKWRDSNE